MKKAIITDKGRHYFLIGTPVKIVKECKRITGKWYLCIADFGSSQWVHEQELKLI